MSSVMVSVTLVAASLLCGHALAASLDAELQSLKGQVGASKSEPKESSKENSQGNSQGNYQKYMQQYAGGQGGASNYMKQYAGKYAGEYEKYANYQTYMKRYQNGEQGQEIGKASDCKTKGCLDKWYAGANENIHAYVPDSYAKFAKKDIDKTYEKDLADIEASTTGGPLEVTNLDEEKTPVANSAKIFMAKSTAKATVAEKLTKEVEKSEIAQSQAAATLQMLADDMRSNTDECAGMGLLGAAFSAVVFFAVRHRRTVQTPILMLG